MSVCLHSCHTYPISKFHLACAAYFQLWPVWLYHVFPHYFITGTIFGKKLLFIELCFDVFINFG